MEFELVCLEAAVVFCSFYIFRYFSDFSSCSPFFYLSFWARYGVFRCWR